MQVACGVIRRADGRILIAQRPPGKLAAGAWEFPGGKIEPGESAEHALARELEEELGIRAQEMDPLMHVTHAYRDRVVVMDAFLVHRFEGSPQGREGQALEWVHPLSLGPDSLLAADWPIVLALRTPQFYVFTPVDADAAFLRNRLAWLPRPCWLRLRQPGLADGEYDAAARLLRPATRELGIGLILDRDPEQVLTVDADGWHATSGALRVLRERPLPDTKLFVASVHDHVELERARLLRADAVVFGPIRETPSHPGQRSVGWEALGDASTRVSCPVFAIGGLDPTHLQVARAAGAHGIAGISAYWSSEFSPLSAGPAGSV